MINSPVRTRLVLLVAGVLTAGACAPAVAQTPAAGAMPPMQRRATTQAIVDEHLDAINKCDWNRLMAQYPADVEFFLPGGAVMKGREAVGELFRNFVKPFRDGGLCGLNFVTEHSLTVGNTVNVQWVATAPFLAEPYRGADAYVTADGLMAAQVTTFQQDQIKPVVGGGR